LRRNASRIGDGQLDLAAAERVVLLLKENDEAALHVDAARGERPGLDGEQADADRLRLRTHDCRKAERRCRRARARRLDELSAIESHFVSSTMENRSSAARQAASGSLRSRRTRFVPCTIDTIL